MFSRDISDFIEDPHIPGSIMDTKAYAHHVKAVSETSTDECTGETPQLAQDVPTTEAMQIETC